MGFRESWILKQNFQKYLKKCKKTLFQVQFWPTDIPVLEISFAVLIGNLVVFCLRSKYYRVITKKCTRHFSKSTKILKITTKICTFCNQDTGQKKCSKFTINRFALIRGRFMCNQIHSHPHRKKNRGKSKLFYIYSMYIGRFHPHSLKSSI